MSSRNLDNFGVRVACALALVAAVTAAPIRATTSAGNRRLTAPVGHDPASSRSTHTSSLLAKWMPSRALQVKALYSENEEEESSGTINPAFREFRLRPTHIGKPDQGFATSQLERANHPLRC